MTATYPSGMQRLLACPFCRELFPSAETSLCPSCGLRLQPMDELPPSLEAAADAAEAGEILAPEDRRLPMTYLGRSKGALLVLGVVGLVGFFLPWVEMTAPEIASYSGYDLARGRAGWLWGGAVGWFILLPLVWTRRTIYKMRGVRVICAVFAAMTLVEVAMMLMLPPRGHRLVSFEFQWGVGFWLSGIASVLGVIAAIRFGGRLDDIPALPWEDRGGLGHATDQRSEGEPLH